MTRKTISGHYDTTYSLEHNNRDFIPRNVDPARIARNDFLVTAGHLVSPDFPNALDMSALWDGYRQANEMYWKGYSLERQRIWRREALCKRQLQLANRLIIPSLNPIVFACQLVLAPLFIAGHIALKTQAKQFLKEVESDKLELQSEKNRFLQSKKSLRQILRDRDRETGTDLLKQMDTLAHRSRLIIDYSPPPEPQFATLDQIYRKVFEPGFQAFQDRQRKCRRYYGSYLDQIRDRQHQAKISGSKSEKTRTQSEAIEIVFTLGDMDNTGYDAAPDDARKAESLLRDFNRHLLTLPNVCTVTTTELAIPDWQPPFKHGLILLNLTAHFDEATPGIHMTAIPYSRGCQRGPEAQPSLGRALTGMGYPSTWRDVLDSDGNPVPKRDRYNNIIYNKDGTPRVQKEPDKQGIIDWIEDQKIWLQQEMEQRYGWEREYKGKHPRGNLSTPDYRAARAKERVTEAAQQMKSAVQQYAERAYQLSKTLEQTVYDSIDNRPDMAVILNYLQICPDNRFEALLDEALSATGKIPANECNKIKGELSAIIADAQRKAQQNSSAVSRMQNRDLRQ